LRLAHHLARSGDVEVFTLGTRLTRITPAMAHPDVDTALLQAGDLIPDWSGGTRLADTLGAFISRWGRRGMARAQWCSSPATAGSAAIRTRWASRCGNWPVWPGGWCGPIRTPARKDTSPCRAG